MARIANGRVLSSLIALLLAASAQPAAAALKPLAASDSSPTAVPGRVIVEWAPRANRSEKTVARQEAEVQSVGGLGDPAFQLLEVDPRQTVAGAIEGLEADPTVLVAERDGYAVPTSIPDDPLFGQEWALRNDGSGIDGFSGAIAGDDIGAPAAWDRTVGDPSVVVADIDSGYRFDSPDLGPVAWENPGEIPGNGIDDDGNGYVDDVHGYDFVGNDAESPAQDDDPTDDDLITGGHGVHTAGTIGAAGDNGVGITGVAQNVRIMPLRVCAHSAGAEALRCPISSLIAAINYAGANGARVANMSLTATSSSTAELDALEGSPHTLFVAAAGNDAQDNDVSGHYPCDFELENLICVAATDQADELASFSDWGSESVDLGAPGTEILSTYPGSEALIADDFEENDFGTRWKPTGVDGGFGRTDEAPLTSFGISDSPGAPPEPNSVRSSTLSSPVPVPAEYGGCRLSGRYSASLGGGTLAIVIFKNGVSAYTFELPDTGGGPLQSFTTVSMELAGSNVEMRVRYAAGASPGEGSGAWLDDLELNCADPLSTPPTYAFMQGTSMAAPQVSGAAALLFSAQPSAGVEAVRYALLSGVDAVPSLAGRTTSGGRLDVARALTWLEPPAPVLSTDPPSPAEEADPHVLGSAAVGTRVLLFAGAGCQGEALQTGTVAELESPGFEVHVPDETTEQLSALVETRYESSPCSGPISYTNSTPAPDVTPPGPPLLTATDPASPSPETHPRIVGSAEAGSGVTIYARPSCEGAAVARGDAAELESPGIAAEASLGTTTFSARATDRAGNTSACSAPLAYTNTTPFVTIAVPLGESAPTPSPAASPPPPVTPPAATVCLVPKLAGKTLSAARAALRSAGCKLGKVKTRRPGKRQRKRAIVVRHSTPAAGARTAGGVSLELAPR